MRNCKRIISYFKSALYFDMKCFGYFNLIKKIEKMSGPQGIFY